LPGATPEKMGQLNKYGARMYCNYMNMYHYTTATINNYYVCMYVCT